MLVILLVDNSRNQEDEYDDEDSSWEPSSDHEKDYLPHESDTDHLHHGKNLAGKKNNLASAIIVQQSNASNAITTLTTPSVGLQIFTVDSSNSLSHAVFKH